MTEARPNENATISASPNASRCSAIAESSTTSADGHGSRPPDTPSAISDRIESSSGGACEWPWP